MSPAPDVPRSGLQIGLTQVALAGVLWGTGGVVVTLLHERDGLGPLTTSAWRMALAAVALLVFVVLTRRRGALVATLRERPGRVAAIGCGTALYQGLYFVAVLCVGVSVATVVSLGVAPIMAAGWEHRRAGTRPTRGEVVVLVAALVGLFMMSLSAGHGSRPPLDRPLLGLALAVASGAVYAGTTLLGHGLAQQVEPVVLTTGATLFGAVALAPFLVVAAGRGAPLVPTGTTSWLLMIYLGLATMALAYGLLYAGLRVVKGSAATIATLVEPLSAALLAALVLSERITLVAVLGGLLILAAVVALSYGEDDPPVAI